LITDNIGEATFEQADIPLAMVATDIYNGEKVILKKGSVSKAVMASTCVPGLFNPIEVKDRILVDGGIVENVPISPLLEMDAEYLIGVALGTGSTREKPENIIDVLLRAFYSLSNQPQNYTWRKPTWSLNRTWLPLTSSAPIKPRR
jgi:NTE family protein